MSTGVSCINGLLYNASSLPAGDCWEGRTHDSPCYGQTGQERAWGRGQHRSGCYPEPDCGRNELSEARAGYGWDALEENHFADINPESVRDRTGQHTRRVPHSPGRGFLSRRFDAVRDVPHCDSCDDMVWGDRSFTDGTDLRRNGLELVFCLSSVRIQHGEPYRSSGTDDLYAHRGRNNRIYSDLAMGVEAR